MSGANKIGSHLAPVRIRKLFLRGNVTVFGVSRLSDRRGASEAFPLVTAASWRNLGVVEGAYPIRISHVLLTLSLLLGPLSGASGAAVDDVPSDLADLTGVYICTGKNFDGTTYEGVVEIVRRNDTFQLVWFIDSEVVALGVGIRSGNLLSVAYSRVPRLVSFAHEEVR